MLPPPLSDNPESTASVISEPVDAALFLQGVPLLDVRAPIEFARGALPGAVNLPLLDDHQREQVGIAYKRHGQASAIALGEELMTPHVREQKLKAWSEFLHRYPDARLYCFRGGLRSKIVQQWLDDVGIRCPLVPGGYKAMRSFLLHALQRCSSELPFLVLGGRTGTGKTRLLRRLPRMIDLEALALHRGSSFGKLLRPQPSNIDFENALCIQMMHHESACRGPQATGMDGSLPAADHVFLEDEGRLIGRVCLPDVLRERMLKLPVVVLEETLQTRVEVATLDYVKDLLTLYQRHYGEEDGFERFAQHHLNSLRRISKRFGSERVLRTTALFNEALQQHRRTGDLSGYRDYIETLLCDYYDPMYDYQFSSKSRATLFSGSADEICAWVETEIIGHATS